MSRTNPVISFITFTILLSAIFLVAPVPAVYAASITVNSSCSLSDAITAANTDTATGGCPAGSGADTITLTGNITMTAANPYIYSNITIQGGGYTISGNHAYRILDIFSGTITINNVALTKGSAHGAEGAAIFISGCSECSGGNVTITNSSFTDNKAHWGAAIFSYGTLSISNSTFSNNNASARAGGAIHGGYGNVTIVNSTFTGNSATWGGAIYISRDTAHSPSATALSAGTPLEFEAAQSTTRGR